MWWRRWHFFWSGRLPVGADFFGNAVGIAQAGGNTIDVPHTNYGPNSSIAPTIGSRPSSITPKALKHNGFEICSSSPRPYLVLGDFESTMLLCLSSERYTALYFSPLVMVSRLLKCTWNAYFERRITALPYLRLCQYIVPMTSSTMSRTLICKDDKKYLLDSAPSPIVKGYLVSQSSWKSTEENRMIDDEDGLAGSYYSAQARTLQSVIEKIAEFRLATKYQDGQPTAISDNDISAVKTYKLANSYDRYFEYASCLSTQGIVKEVSTYVKLREKILGTAGVSAPECESAAPTPAVPFANQSHL
ncbi:hypothetical protein AGABI1DRAFT_127316 [Agaricus bisporus var. burnettii JB137-S8]|uniref:Uncharacterized protein n=1 Tax=Agaricus bisporus var. burnettii (strain JB137-S8 / ATCC MYA-4627 / FGSC 10392) TaxID=597362 RepID=K5XDR2_AGABU|nr:uncharacterized protein AGABI1DRAFT_127316 [Agaricus bisporus var. burnettii JB137-S8]EKM81307.1 hypothetical protein AGABI1DRAFT_127316 [Agaricus bisporus var. burnettii JB137-S8]